MYYLNSWYKHWFTLSFSSIRETSMHILPLPIILDILVCTLLAYYSNLCISILTWLCWCLVSAVCVCLCLTCPSGLAYCRHLSTVRTHLSALVNHNIVPPDRPCEASGGLSKEVWSKYQKDCKVGTEQSVRLKDKLNIATWSTSVSKQQELQQRN